MWILGAMEVLIEAVISNIGWYELGQIYFSGKSKLVETTVVKIG